MEDHVNKSVLRLVVAQICLSLGWHSVTRFTLDILTDIIERYLKKISNTVADVCQHDGRLSPTLEDISFVFDHLRISPLELEDYLHQVEQAPLCRTLPQCPAPKVTVLKHAAEGEERPEYIEPHFPPLEKVKVQKKEEAELLEGPLQSEAASEVAEGEDPVDPLKMASLVSRKRSYDSPPYSPIEPKRLNLDAQLLVPDLTRPDLKVSTPKELSVVTPADDHPKLPIKASPIPPRVLAEKTQYFNERMDTPIKTKDLNVSYSKETLKKESEKRGSPKPSLSIDFSSRDRMITPAQAKTPEKERKAFPTPLKPTPDKSERVAFSVTSPRAQGPSIPPSSPKVKTRKSPKPGKAPSVPKSPDLGLKVSPALPKKPTPPLSSPHKVSPPLASLPETKKKETKLRKKVGKKTEALNEKKKKTPTSEKTEKEKPSLSVKISPLQMVIERPPKKKKKPASSLTAAASLFSSYASETPSEKPSVPKLVFKPLPFTPEPPISSASDSWALNAVEKEKGKSKKKAETPGLKKKLKISFGDSKLGREDKSKEGKGGKVKKKKKLKGAKGNEGGSKASSQALSTEKAHGPTVKLKIDAGPEEGLKLSFHSSMMKPPISSPKKKSSELYGVVPPFQVDTTPIGKMTEGELPTKKAKMEKKKKKKVEAKEAQQSKTLKIPKKSKEGKKDGDSKSSKLKKTPKEPSASPLVQPIPKLTLRMDSSSSMAETLSASSKLVVKPLPSPTKGTSPAPAVKKSKSSTSASAKTAAAGFQPASKKNASTVAPPAPLLPAASIVGGGALEDTPQRGVFTVTLAQTNVASAEVYYCPACQRPDDGSPMIGCDGCDLWYHWPCVGVLYAPKDDEQWFCRSCTEKQKKKKKKKKKES